MLHNTVARNNVQPILNKQKERKKVFTCLHYIRVVMLHIWVVCFERMAAWKECYDMWKVCGNIFEGCNVRQKLNVKHISSWNLQLYDDIYIGICRIFQKCQNVSIQSEVLLCCRSKVCSDAFVNLFLPSFLQHVCVLKL